MKWAIYNLLFAAVYPFLLPGFLLRMLRRGGYAARFWDRFALYPPSLHSNLEPSETPPCLRASVLKNTEPDHHCPPPPVHSTSLPVWIHAVSVGEVQVAGQLMREWRKVDPSVRFVFSTTSSTGWKIAEKEVEGNDILIYNPLDFPNFVKSALKTFRPRAIVLTESEIWPNFIRKAKSYGIPLYLINARVSDRSAPRYRLARWFFGDVFSCFTRIFAQSQLDADRLVAAGAPREVVEVTGSFKFDVAHRNEAKEGEMREWIGERWREFEGRRKKEEGRSEEEELPKILLGGSTWPGEDAVLLKIYRQLIDRLIANYKLRITEAGSRITEAGGRITEARGRITEAGGRITENDDDSKIRKFENSKIPLLVLAPRHFEKADAVEANIRAAGFDCIRRSRTTNPEPRVCNLQPRVCNLQSEICNPQSSTSDLQPSTSDLPPVFLADTTGELMGLYGIADVVFVGKSLCAHGSQNMIEPCLCGKPTFTGPNTENFRPVMSDLLASEAIVQVKDEAELEAKILDAFERPENCRALAERARAAVAARCGVVAKCLRTITASLR